MTENMIERAAKALRNEFWPHMHHSLCKDYVRVVIEAVSDPSDKMIESGGRQYDFPSVFMGGASYQGKRYAEKIFRNMIAIALDEDQPTPK